MRAIGYPFMRYGHEARTARTLESEMAEPASAPRGPDADLFSYLMHAPMEPLNCTVQLSDASPEL